VSRRVAACRGVTTALTALFPPRRPQPLGLEVRAGLHTGESEPIGEKVGGIAVHIGARVAALAGPSKVLVSSTVKDLVAGLGIRFEDRGAYALKAMPDQWCLLGVEQVRAG